SRGAWVRAPCLRGARAARSLGTASRGRGYSQPVGKASDWLREERRKVLGDWVAVCLRCGAGRRWFEQFESEVPDACPECGGELLRRGRARAARAGWGGAVPRRCGACGAAFSSTAAFACEEGGEPLRPNELFGSKIR